MTKKNIAVITGGATGLGFATAQDLGKKGYTVCLIGRKPEKLKKAVEELKRENITAYSFLADVSKTDDTRRVSEEIADQFSHIDVLVNNAGVFVEWLGSNPNLGSVFKVDEDVVLNSFNNNTLSAMRMIKGLMPLLEKSEAGRIVNVSSGMGQLSEMEGMYPAYRLSKTAMNALTRIVADEISDTKIKINSVCPGWVKTEMGGSDAELEIADGIKGIVWAATLPVDGPTGGFFRHGEKIDW